MLFVFTSPLFLLARGCWLLSSRSRPVCDDYHNFCAFCHTNFDGEEQYISYFIIKMLLDSTYLEWREKYRFNGMFLIAVHSTMLNSVHLKRSYSEPSNNVGMAFVWISFSSCESGSLAWTFAHVNFLAALGLSGFISQSRTMLLEGIH